MIDILSVGLWGLLTGKTKTIGIVPADYFSYHTTSSDPHNQCNFSTTSGITIPWWEFGGLATEGFWTASAHELGHTFGLQIGAEEYDITCPDPVHCLPGRPATGYWVSKGIPIDPLYGAFCFMGTGLPFTLNQNWVDNEHYSQLMKALSNDSAADPEVLVVSGLLHSNGAIDLRPWYYLANGTATANRPANYAVRVKDGNGQVLTETQFPVAFSMQVEPVGSRPTDTVPLLLAVPYPKSAAIVEVIGNDQTLVSVSPQSKLLRDSIGAIPDSGFLRNPAETRDALLNKVAAIEKQIAVGDYFGARQKLQNDLSKQVESWLLDGYTKVTPLQLEKAEVLKVIDDTAARLQNLAQGGRQVGRLNASGGGSVVINGNK